jgi:hypothetical protein
MSLPANLCTSHRVPPEQNHSVAWVETSIMVYQEAAQLVPPRMCDDDARAALDFGLHECTGMMCMADKLSSHMF